MVAKHIIMNFSTPPSVDDLMALAASTLDNLPEELMDYTDELEIVIEEFPDEAMEQELDLEDSYELLALYRNGNEVSPGIKVKSNDDEDFLILFRRPILDMWAETEEDLGMILRQVMIEELGKVFDFSDEEIEDMSDRHFQGML